MWLWQLASPNLQWGPTDGDSEDQLEDFPPKANSLKTQESWCCKWSLKAASWGIPFCRGRLVFLFYLNLQLIGGGPPALWRALIYAKFTDLNGTLTTKTPLNRHTKLTVQPVRWDGLRPEDRENKLLKVYIKDNCRPMPSHLFLIAEWSFYWLWRFFLLLIKQPMN